MIPQDPTSRDKAVPEELPSVPDGRPKKRRRALIIAVALLLVAAIAATVVSVYLRRWDRGEWEPSKNLVGTLRWLTESTELMKRVDALKADVKDLAANLKEQDAAQAELARDRMRVDAEELRAYLDTPLMRTAYSTPGVRDQLSTVDALLDLLDEADGAMIAPAVDLVKNYPLTELNGPDGVRVETLKVYLDFLEQKLPEAKELMPRLRQLDLHLFDSEGKLEAYMEKLDELFAATDDAIRYLPAIRAVLGDGNDRLYLFAAQNSSEIRASGGFPGSVGCIRIRDGYLSISDFQSVYDVLQMTTPSQAGINYLDDLLFSGRMHLSWDADFSPDFERVASIWAMAYEARHHEPVNGVISGTPAIIPRLLSFLGSVTLSDGTELTAENAARVLGHDLYFTYLGRSRITGGAKIVDSLFSEAAVGTLHLLLGEIRVGTLPDLLRFVQQSTADRTLMLWMADEAEQELIREAGWNAGLNTDPSHPMAGIFFNSTVPSKIAWFLNIEPELSEPVLNEDGSQTYDLTIRLSNVLTTEELNEASSYILGDSDRIIGSMYVLAPAGGRIDEAWQSSGRPTGRAVYEGLDMVYLLEVSIRRDEPYLVTCRITTAPGVEEPMGLMSTPTMQQFR